MSRGTRIGGDVMGLIVEEHQPDLLSEEINFPKDFYPGTGRVLNINERLRRIYEELAWHVNKKTRAHQASEKANTLQGDSYWVTIDINNYNIDEADRDIKFIPMTALPLIREVKALGGVPFIPEFVHRFIKKELDQASVLQDGSLAYLCDSPHYFAPEEFSVPEGLPKVDKMKSKDPQNISELNYYLSKKYGILAKYLNRIHYFRDHRLRLQINAKARVDANYLGSEMKGCRQLFDAVVAMINNWKANYGDKIFRMPTSLRDKIMEDNAMVNQRELGDLSFLYPEGCPEGSSPISHGLGLYVLVESALGFSLFRAKSSAAADSSDHERFMSDVKLVVHYPFPSRAVALAEYSSIENGTLSVTLRLLLEMYLPEPAPWSWGGYRLGVPNKKLGVEIKSTLGIICRTKKYMVKELRRGIRQYLHLFLEIEQSHLEEAQLDLDKEDAKPQAL